MAPRDFVLLMLVCLVWATNFVVTKLAVTVLHMPPLFLSALRFLIVFIAVSPWLLPWPRPRWRIVLVGVMMGAGGFGLVSVGLLYATPSSAAVVGQLGVPITALLSVAMLGEKVGWQRGFGIALAFAGAVVVMYDPRGFALSVGLIFVVASACTSSFGIVLMKKMSNVGPLQFQAWTGLASALPLAAASLALESGQVAAVMNGGWRLAAVVLYVALVVSLVAHSLFFRLVQKYEASLISTLTLMCPLMAVGLGVLLTGDRIDTRMIVGTAVVLAGVGLILAVPRRRSA